ENKKKRGSLDVDFRTNTFVCCDGLSWRRAFGLGSAWSVMCPSASSDKQLIIKILLLLQSAKILFGFSFVLTTCLKKAQVESVPSSFLILPSDVEIGILTLCSSIFFLCFSLTLWNQSRIMKPGIVYQLVDSKIGLWNQLTNEKMIWSIFSLCMLIKHLLHCFILPNFITKCYDQDDYFKFF
ncbi:hypothetical protein V8G54_008669, partial [Vigna mungo]